jgi:hypothetical protein
VSRRRILIYRQVLFSSAIDSRAEVARPNGPLGFARLDDHGGGNTVMVFGRDRPSHDLDDLMREER